MVSKARGHSLDRIPCEQLLGGPKDVERRHRDLDRNCDGGGRRRWVRRPGAPYLGPTASWTVQVSTARSVNDQCAVRRRTSIRPQPLRRCVLFDNPWVLAVIATPLIRGGVRVPQRCCLQWG